MSTILDQIIHTKVEEVEQRKRLHTQSELEAMGEAWKPLRHSLKASLTAAHATGIIAEFKRKSPSKGWFTAPDRDVRTVVAAYEQGGASAISVLTDTNYFGGGLSDLERAKRTVTIPVLRKDFMIDPWQIAEASAYGADVILLIAACLSPAQVKSLAVYARSLGLEVLLELHDAQELGHICKETEIIGINNRNLKTFEVDIARSLDMARSIPGDKIKVAESGISAVDTIRVFRDEGFRGFLIGENFMKAENPGLAFQEFATLLQQA